MGVLSYSQAKHFKIQYFTELIWNKPLTLGRRGQFVFASSG